MIRSARYQYDAFIAYAEPDFRSADILYQLLTAIGYVVFLSRRTLILGENWPEEIRRAQDSSLVTVVLISNHSDSAFFQREEILSGIGLARAHRHRVIPVYLNASAAERTTIPYGLKQLHSIVWDGSASLLSVAQEIDTALRASKRQEQSRHDIDERTIIIVTGCHHFAEIYDRPTANDLKEEINRLEPGFGKSFLGSVVMGDIWFQQQSGIGDHTNVVSLGSSGINNLTRTILEQATTIRTGPEEKWKVARNSNKWALFGNRGEDTRAAVASFMQNDLSDYLEEVWSA